MLSICARGAISGSDDVSRAEAAVKGGKKEKVQVTEVLEGELKCVKSEEN